MGAANFETILVGKDLNKAFSEAVRQYQYEYGHGGYTGTIAEKDGYYLAGKMPARLTMSRLVSLVFAYEDWEWSVADYRNGYSKRKPKANPVPEQWQSFVAKVAQAYGDKWGPAAIIELTGTQAAKIKAARGRKGTQDKVWVAVGMASE